MEPLSCLELEAASPSCAVGEGVSQQLSLVLKAEGLGPLWGCSRASLQMGYYVVSKTHVVGEDAWNLVLGEKSQLS